MALTKRQKEVLNYLVGFLDKNGYSPSFEEIARALKLTSLATVHKHLSTLERKGFIRRGYNQSRSIEVVQLPKSVREQVLERNSTIGGCLRTEEVTAPGFLHDVMATTLVLFRTSPAYQALGKDLEARGFAFADTNLPTAVLRPDGSSVILSMDRARNIKTFDALAEGDPDAAETTLRHHLRMVLSALPAIRAQHPEYFEEERR